MFNSVTKQLPTRRITDGPPVPAPLVARRMGRIVSALIFAFALMAAGGARPTFGQQPQGASIAETLTLEQAIDIAVGGNRTLRIAELSVERAKEETDAQRTRFYPSSQFNGLIAQPLSRLDFTVRKGQLGTDSSTGPIPNEDTKLKANMTPRALVNVQVNQPLSQLYRLGLSRRMLKLGEEIAAEDVRLNRQSVVADVKRVYLHILQAQSTLTSAEESVKLYKETQAVTTQYFEQGTVLRPAVFEVDARLGQSELNVFTLQNQVATLKEQLNQLLGRDVRTEFNVSHVSDAVAYTVNSDGLKDALDRALAQRPELRQARLRAEQAALDKRVKKSEYIPDVSANFGYVSQFNFNEFLPRSSMGAGVMIQTEIFDWGRRRREIRGKALAEEQARINVAETESALLREVAAKYRQLKEAARKLEVAGLTRKTARASTQVALYNYREQAVLLKDLLQAQTALADANSQYQRDLSSFWTAKAEFDKAVGEEK